MKKTDIEITRYEHGEFWVDIVHEPDGYYSAWLTHKDYGVSSMMFGADEPLDSFITMVEANLDCYIEDYRKEYMDD